MNYTEVKKVFEQIMLQAGKKKRIMVNDVEYPSHKIYALFRSVLIEFENGGGSIEEFKNKVIDANYFKKAKEGLLSDVQHEFLHDVIDLISDNCPDTESLDYDDLNSN